MQYFFRARVAAQAFTVLALWAGIYVYEDDRKSRNWKYREKAEAAAKAKHVAPTITFKILMLLGRLASCS
jgi:Hypoxia induced protein conserved region